MVVLVVDDDELVEEAEDAGSEVGVAVVSGTVVGPATAGSPPGSRASSRPPATPPTVASTPRTIRTTSRRLLTAGSAVGALGGRQKAAQGSLSRPMRSRGLPAAVVAAASDREGGAMEVAATALDGLLEVATNPDQLESAVAVLLAGQPAMAPIWHLARAARGPDPPPALAALRRSLDTDAGAAVTAATAWLRDHLATTSGTVASPSPTAPW